MTTQFNFETANNISEEEAQLAFNVGLLLMNNTKNGVNDVETKKQIYDMVKQFYNTHKQIQT